MNRWMDLLLLKGTKQLNGFNLIDCRKESIFRLCVIDWQTTKTIVINRYLVINVINRIL